MWNFNKKNINQSELEFRNKKLKQLIITFFCLCLITFSVFIPRYFMFINDPLMRFLELFLGLHYILLLSFYIIFSWAVVTFFIRKKIENKFAYIYIIGVLTVLLELIFVATFLSILGIPFLYDEYYYNYFLFPVLIVYLILTFRYFYKNHWLEDYIKLQKKLKIVKTQASIELIIELLNKTKSWLRRITRLTSLPFLISIIMLIIMLIINNILLAIISDLELFYGSEYSQYYLPDELFTLLRWLNVLIIFVLFVMVLCYYHFYFKVKDENEIWHEKIKILEQREREFLSSKR